MVMELCDRRGDRMRLIDIEKLRGCAIIRPCDELEVKVIESFSDKIKHQDIPTAYDVDGVVRKLDEMKRKSLYSHAISSSDEDLGKAFGFEIAIDVVEGGGKSDK